MARKQGMRGVSDEDDSESDSDTAGFRAEGGLAGEEGKEDKEDAAKSGLGAQFI